MKNLMFLVLVLLLPSLAMADRLVSDPSPSNVGMSFEIWQAAKGLDDLKVVATGKMIVSKTCEADGSISYVLDSLVPGSFNWYIRTFGQAYFYGPDNTNGGSTLYSVFVPFDFTKRTPTAGSIKGLKLAP